MKQPQRILSRDHQTRSLLATWNLAALQWRNDAYGHQFVDAEIAEFESMLNAATAEDATLVRTGGATFLTVFSCTQEAALTATLQVHQQFRRVTQGAGRQTIHGHGRGKSFYERLHRPLEIARAVRVIYAPLSDTSDQDQLTQSLLDLNYCVDPSEPISLETRQRMSETRWRCVRWAPGFAVPCLACGHKSLELNVVSDVGHAEGSCPSCGAEFGLPNYANAA
jgi:GGDEF domain-containing protein